MFQLFKKRNFSDYISDTFSFFKYNGKHFFTQYFTINGVFLLILTALVYFVFKIYFEVIFSSLGVGNSNSSYVLDYFNNNIGLIIGVGVFFVLLLIFVSLLNFAFPAIYFNLYEKNKGNSFSTKDTITYFKENAWKITRFFLLLMLMSIPVGALLVGVFFLLIIIIIGIPFVLILMPALVSWLNISFFHYMNTNDGFFRSFGNGFRYIKQGFWPIVGSTMVIYIIIQVIMTIISMIPYVIGVASLFSNLDQNGQSDSGMGTFGILMTVVMVLSILLSYIMNNILLVNSGIVYYSMRETNENNNSKTEIDLIGSNESE